MAGRPPVEPPAAKKITAVRRPGEDITVLRGGRGREISIEPKGEPRVTGKVPGEPPAAKVAPQRAAPEPVRYDPIAHASHLSDVEKARAAEVTAALVKMEPVQRVKYLLDLDPRAGLPETWRLEAYVALVGRDDASVKALGDAMFRQVMRGAVAAGVGDPMDRLLSPRMLGMRLQHFAGNVQQQLGQFTARQKELLWRPGFEDDVRTFGDMIAFVFPRAMDKGMAGWRVGEVLDMSAKARYWELAKLYLADMTILSPKMITLLAQGFRKPATRGQAINMLRSFVTFATHQAVSAVAGDDDPSTWEEAVGEDAHHASEDDLKGPQRVERKLGIQ
jgi:hypothetical protein